MIFSPKCTAIVPRGSLCSCTIHSDCSLRVNGFSGHSEPRRPSEATPSNGADKPLVVSAKEPPRILLVDAVLALCEFHIAPLRSVPALVERLVSCADMYLHEEDAYALVILVLHPNARETPEVAHFVRHRWSAARILLLESESASIDDWLYDERVDPNPNPSTIRDAAIRLMAEEKHGFQHEGRRASRPLDARR